MGMALLNEVARMNHDDMPIRELREVARQKHLDHDPDAARAFIDRVLDIEVERRTWYAHENPGYQPISSAALMGEQPGGGSAAADPLVMRYDRGIRIHEAHEWAEGWLKSSGVKQRNMLAVLIRSAKMHPRQTQQGTPWCKSYDDIAANIRYYAQLLGFPPGINAMTQFKDGQALKNAARHGRIELILLAKR